MHLANIDGFFFLINIFTIEPQNIQIKIMEKGK